MYNLLGFPVYISLCCIAYLLRRLSSAAISRHPISPSVTTMYTRYIIYIYIYIPPPPPPPPSLPLLFPYVTQSTFLVSPPLCVLTPAVVGQYLTLVKKKILCLQHPVMFGVPPGAHLTNSVGEHGKNTFVPTIASLRQFFFFS
ncbi:unnamed protein product [Ixodes pacificus]